MARIHRENLEESLKSWNIEDCNTPTTYFSTIHGMCEALNGTFKRDYVYESCLDNAQTVLTKYKMGKRIQHFCPHSSLEMKTPKNEFYIF